MCELPEVMRESVQASRKPRRCCECGWPIESGERYHRTWGVWDGEPMTFIACLRCIAARDEHLSNLAANRERPELCWTYGDLYEEVTSCESMDHGPEVTLLIARVQYRTERKEAERYSRLVSEGRAQGLESEVFKQLAEDARERWEDARDALVEAGFKLPLAKCSVCSELADVGPGEPCPACACSET